MSDLLGSPDDYLRHVRVDAERMAELAGRGLDEEVPSCPGWTVRDVLEHTGAVFSHKVACMRLPDGPQSVDDWSHGPVDGEDLVEWFRHRTEELVDQLETRGPEAPCYTWYEPDRTVGFWFRRMAQEVAVHRTDVESAVGGASAIDDDLAVDGIDEVLERFLAYQAADVGPDGPGRGTVAVRTGEHVWRSTLRADSIELSRAPGPADAVVSGEPSELLLWLWGRRPDSAVTTEGDEALLTGFRERLHTVSQ
jgi:uncharacterized protein (TIGR03083 family)